MEAIITIKFAWGLISICWPSSLNPSLPDGPEVVPNWTPFENHLSKRVMSTFMMSPIGGCLLRYRNKALESNNRGLNFSNVCLGLVAWPLRYLLYNGKMKLRAAVFHDSGVQFIMYSVSCAEVLFTWNTNPMVQNLTQWTSLRIKWHNIWKVLGTVFGSM